MYPNEGYSMLGKHVEYNNKCSTKKKLINETSSIKINIGSSKSRWIEEVTGDERNLRVINCRAVTRERDQ